MNSTRGRRPSTMGPMTTAIRDEGTLVAAARAGDERAFAEADRARSSVHDLVTCLREAGVVHYLAHPLFDMSGSCVGVNSAIYSPTGGSVGIGFDIPADVAQSISQQLISDGKITRGYIGARRATAGHDGTGRSGPGPGSSTRAFAPVSLLP